MSIYFPVSPGVGVELGNQFCQSVVVCNQLAVGLMCTLCCCDFETWACHETLSK